MLIDYGCQSLYMPVHTCFARLNDGFETQPLPFAITGRTGSSDSVLADLKPEKIKSHGPIIRVEGMGNLGFARFQFQPQRLEPLGNIVLDLMNDGFVGIEHDEVVRVADNQRQATAPVRRLASESLRNCRFQPVQGDIRK